MTDMNNDKNILKCALFDLDGVVFDTESQYSVFWGGVFRRYYPGTSGLENQIKGQTLVQIYDRYFKDDTQRQDCITRDLKTFEQQMDFPFIAGFEQFAADLRSHGVKTAVVTSSNRMKMEAVYRKHGEMKHLFDAILTSEDFERSKPDPDCYLKGAQRFGCQIDECVVFEDSFNGLKSGRAAGMFVVGLSTTNSAEAIAPYADVVVDDFSAMDYETLLNLKTQSTK